MEEISVQYFLTCYEVQQNEDDTVTLHKVFDSYPVEEVPTKITFSVVAGVQHNYPENKILLLKLLDKRKKSLTEFPFETQLEKGKNFTVINYVLQKVPVKRGTYYAFLSVDDEIIAKLEFTITTRGEQDEHNDIKESIV